MYEYDQLLYSLSIRTWLILIRKTYNPFVLYGASSIILDISYVIEKYNHAIDPLLQDAWHNYGRDKNWPNRECVREGVYCKQPWKKDRFKKQKVIEMITWKTWLEKKVLCVRLLYINCINGIYVLSWFRVRIIYISLRNQCQCYAMPSYSVPY